MSALYTFFLTVGLLASGTCIPLILTFQNHHIVSEPGEPPVYFGQPLLQTTMIFLGEIICIFVIQLASKSPRFLERSVLQVVGPPPHPQAGTSTSSYGDHSDWASTRVASKWALSWFIVPSACDLIATTLMNIGLFYSTPSAFQMVRSSIVGFSAIFSFVLLSRQFLGHEWAAVATIVVGTGLISWSAAEVDWKGPAYLLASQMFVAGQFVLEEYLMDRYRLDPIKAMGIEGAYGTVLLVLSLLGALTFGSDLLDVKAGLSQMIESYVLWQSALALAIVVAVFSFFGLAVSSAVGVPGRSTIDALRTLLIWLIAIHYEWDTFSWLELGGFLVLTIGVFVFNGVFTWIREHVKRPARHNETTPLIS